MSVEFLKIILLKREIRHPKELVALLTDSTGIKVNIKLGKYRCVKGGTSPADCMA